VAGGKGVARTARLADDELGSLVRSAQRGRRRALDALLAKLRPWFVGFFARWVDDRDTAEDLAQAALVRVWQALPRIRADRPVHYIVTIAMNLLRTAREDLRRAERRRATLKLNPPMAAPVTPIIRPIAFIARRSRSWSRRSGCRPRNSRQTRLDASTSSA